MSSIHDNPTIQTRLNQLSIRFDQLDIRHITPFFTAESQDIFQFIPVETNKQYLKLYQDYEALIMDVFSKEIQFLYQIDSNQTNMAAYFNLESVNIMFNIASINVEKYNKSIEIPIDTANNMIKQIEKHCISYSDVMQLDLFDFL